MRRRNVRILRREPLNVLDYCVLAILASPLAMALYYLWTLLGCLL